MKLQCHEMKFNCQWCGRPATKSRATANSKKNTCQAKPGAVDQAVEELQLAAPVRLTANGFPTEII